MHFKRYMAASLAVAAFGLAGCGEERQQILIPVPDESEEATLTDFSGGRLTEPSAFDLISGDAVRTDQFPGWDFLLEFLPDGRPVLWPRSSIIEQDSDSGLQPVATTFEGLTEAPEQGYVQEGELPISEGDVFAVRSRRDPAFGNVRCRRFAKIEILSIDRVEGRASLKFLVNPNCEKRTLILGAEE